MEKAKQSIQVNIAGRNYPFTINPEEEEEVIRLAVKRISERVDTFTRKYAIKDAQDALAIIGFQFVVQLINEERKNKVGAIVDDLHSLDDQLDEYLKSCR